MNNPVDFASTCAWLKDDVELRLAEDFRRDGKIHSFALVWATYAPGSDQPYDEPRRLVMPGPVVLEGQLDRDAYNQLYAHCIRKLALEARAGAVAFVTMANVEHKRCVVVVLEHKDGKLLRRAVEKRGELGPFEDMALPAGHCFEGIFRDFLPSHWMQ